MGGVFGIVSSKRCVEDLVLGTSYLQHRNQDYCGVGLKKGGELRDYPHAGLIKTIFTKNYLGSLEGNWGVGAVSNYRQPTSEFSKFGGAILCFDGRISNSDFLKNKLLNRGASFSGYRSPEQVSDNILISKIISKEPSFEKGVEKLTDMMEGDFAILSLAQEGIYASRGWGRKPLILGKREEDYAVSSESNSFENTGFEIVRDVEPGETVLLNEKGICSLAKLDLSPIKYGTFEWIYSAYPPSVIQGRCVADVRFNIGELLAKKYPVNADVVSPLPNSGRWHALGYAKESGIPYEEVFVRYDYSDRSFTPAKQEDRDKEAKVKLIPLKSRIQGRKIVLVDDSIVRGTQMWNRVLRLKALGAKEVHARIACPPLKAACRYGYSIKENEDCIATRMDLNSIRKKLNLDSLRYATVEDLEEAIGFSREKLCLECWGL